MGMESSKNGSINTDEYTTNAHLEDFHKRYRGKSHVKLCLGATGLSAETSRATTFSVSYTLYRDLEKPILAHLWDMGVRASEEDRIQSLWVIRKGLTGFSPSIRKQDQSIAIWLRAKLSEGTVYAPEIPGLPVMKLYGPRATVCLRKHATDTTDSFETFEEVLRNMNGPTMRIKERISNGKWAMIGSIARRGETVTIPRQHLLTLADEAQIVHAAGTNTRLRAEDLKTQVIDKRFDKFAPSSSPWFWLEHHGIRSEGFRQQRPIARDGRVCVSLRSVLIPFGDDFSIALPKSDFV
jgi:hypothetical protein